MDAYKAHTKNLKRKTTSEVCAKDTLVYKPNYTYISAAGKIKNFLRFEYGTV